MDQLPLVAPLLSEIRQLIDQSRQRVAQTVNAELTLLYWNIGQLLKREVLQNERGRLRATDYRNNIRQFNP